jgi:hypothetical protein
MGVDTSEDGELIVGRKPSLKTAIADIASKSHIDKEVKTLAVNAPSVQEAEAKQTLPKVTLYAHSEVLKAIRRIAVDDGVQAQVILRRAVQEYLDKRGYKFEDLTTGK